MQNPSQEDGKNFYQWTPPQSYEQAQPFINKLINAYIQSMISREKIDLARFETIMKNPQQYQYTFSDGNEVHFDFTSAKTVSSYPHLKVQFKGNRCGESEVVGQIYENVPYWVVDFNKDQNFRYRLEEDIGWKDVIIDAICQRCMRPIRR